MLVERAGWPKGKSADNFLKTPFAAAGRRPSGVECVLLFLCRYHIQFTTIFWIDVWSILLIWVW